jgi:hypothetical protein
MDIGGSGRWQVAGGQMGSQKEGSGGKLQKMNFFVHRGKGRKAAMRREMELCLE